MKVIPMGERVLVLPEREKAKDVKTPSGIVLPSSASRHNMTRATVVAVGFGCKDVKDLSPSQARAGITKHLHAGQIVLIEGYRAGSEIMIEGEMHLIVEENEILAVIEE